jgi:hypothetical protein
MNQSSDVRPLLLHTANHTCFWGCLSSVTENTIFSLHFAFRHGRIVKIDQDFVFAESGCAIAGKINTSHRNILFFLIKFFMFFERRFLDIPCPVFLCPQKIYAGYFNITPNKAVFRGL